MGRALGFRISHLKFVNIEIMDSNAFMLTKFPHISIWVCFWGERNDRLQMQSPHESEILNRRICTSVVHQTPQKFGKIIQSEGSLLELQSKNTEKGSVSRSNKIDPPRDLQTLCSYYRDLSSNFRISISKRAGNHRVLYG